MIDKYQPTHKDIITFLKKTNSSYTFHNVNCGTYNVDIENKDTEFHYSIYKRDLTFIRADDDNDNDFINKLAEVYN